MSDIPRNDASRILAILLAVAVAMVAWDFSFTTGNNQNTYAIAGLIRLDPDFLQFDWFAHGTVHYHSSFAYVMQIMSVVSPLFSSTCSGSPDWLAFTEYSGH